jgi:tricarballylate dehydrogenase
MAARGLGPERTRRMAGRQLPDPRHALQPGRAAARQLLDEAGADRIGDPSQAHMVAIDARAPLYDGGICTRIDCVSLGVMVNRDAERFYDEGEDFWPKRYAIWGRLVAQQPGQIGYSIIDAKAVGPLHAAGVSGREGRHAARAGAQLGLDPSGPSCAPSRDYNAACRVGRFDHTVLDDCHTEGPDTAKTHWARPIDTPPFYAYPLRPASPSPTWA